MTLRSLILPAKVTTPAVGARTADPLVAARSTPRCPANQSCAGGENGFSTVGELPPTGADQGWSVVAASGWTASPTPTASPTLTVMSATQKRRMANGCLMGTLCVVGDPSEVAVIDRVDLSEVRGACGNPLT